MTSARFYLLNICYVLGAEITKVIWTWSKAQGICGGNHLKCGGNLQGPSGGLCSGGFSPHWPAETGTLPIPPQGTSLIIRAPETEFCSERSWVTLCFPAFFPFLLFLPSFPLHSLLKNFYLKLFLVWCEPEMCLIRNQINVDLLWSKPVGSLQPP